MEREKYIENHILEASLRVFAHPGYDHVTMKDIAREAGIGLEQLFYYFADKQTIFNVLLATRFKECMSSLMEIFVADPKRFQKVKSMIDRESGQLHQRPVMPAMANRVSDRYPEAVFGQHAGTNPRQFAHRFEDQVEEATRQGVLRPINIKSFQIADRLRTPENG